LLNPTIKENEHFPLSCPQAAPRRRACCAIGQLESSIMIVAILDSDTEGNLKSPVYCAFPLDAARRAWGNPSCYSITGFAPRFKAFFAKLDHR
jgi:hypothetical protein